jgi:hypothetical protein
MPRSRDYYNCSPVDSTYRHRSYFTGPVDRRTCMIHYISVCAERATNFFLSFSFFLCFPWGGVLNRPRKCQGRRWWEYGGGQYGRAHRVAERMTFSKAPRPKQRSTQGRLEGSESYCAALSVSDSFFCSWAGACCTRMSAKFACIAEYVPPSRGVGHEDPSVHIGPRRLSETI